MSPPDLLARLRAGAPRLAELLVAETLATPIAELAGAGRAFLESAAQAIARSEVAEPALVTRAAAVLVRLPGGRLADLVPAAVVDAARQLAELRLQIPRQLTLRLLDRAPVRQLLRAQVLRTLVEFARKATAPFTENPVARGLSKLAFGRRARPTTLGSIKSVFSGEAEKRAAEFADTAVDEIIEGLAAQLADPALAREQAAIRVAILEGLLEETGVELGRLAAPHTAATAAIVRRALSRWQPSLAEDLATAVELLLGREVDRPLGDVLSDFGLRDAVAAHAIRQLTVRLTAFLDGEVFARWLEGTLAYPHT